MAQETSGKNISVTQQRLDHLRKVDILQKAELEKSRRLEWRAHQQRLEELDSAKKMILSKDKELAQLNKHLLLKQDECEKLQNEVKRLRSAESWKSVSPNSSSSDLSSMQISVRERDMAMRNSELSFRIRTLEDNLGTLRNQKHSLEVSLSSAHDELAPLQEQNSKLKTRWNELNSTLRSREKKVSRLSKELFDVKTAYQQLHEEFGRVQKDLNVQLNQCADYRKNKDKLMLKNEKLRDAYEKLSGLVKELEEKNRILQEQSLTPSPALSVDDDDLNMSVSSSCSQLQEHIDQLEFDRDELRTKYDEMKDEFRDIRSKYKSLHHQWRRLQIQHDSLLQDQSKCAVNQLGIEKELTSLNAKCRQTFDQKREMFVLLSLENKYTHRIETLENFIIEQDELMGRKGEKCKEEIRRLRNSVKRAATCKSLTTDSHSLLPHNSMHLIGGNDTSQSDYSKIPTIKQDYVEVPAKKYSEAVDHPEQARKKSTSDKEHTVPSRPFLNEELEAVDGSAITTTDSAAQPCLPSADKAMQTSNMHFMTLSLSEEFKTTINPEKVVEECAYYDTRKYGELKQTSINSEKVVEDRASQTFKCDIPDELKQTTIDKMVEDCASQTFEFGMGSEITSKLKQIDSVKIVKHCASQTFEYGGMAGKLKQTTIDSEDRASQTFEYGIRSEIADDLNQTTTSEKMVEDRASQTFEYGMENEIAGELKQSTIFNSENCGMGSEIADELKQTTVHPEKMVEDCASQTIEHGIENEIADELKRQLKQRSIELSETKACIQNQQLLMKREYDRKVDAYKLQLRKQEERILESETKQKKLKNDIFCLRKKMVMECDEEATELAKEIRNSLLKSEGQGFQRESVLTSQEERKLHNDKEKESFQSDLHRVFLVVMDYNPYSLCITGKPELELSVQSGSVLKVIGEMNELGYYTAFFNGEVGLVPANFVQEINILDNGIIGRVTNQVGNLEQSTSNHPGTVDQVQSKVSIREAVLEMSILSSEKDHSPLHVKKERHKIFLGLYDYDPVTSSASANPEFELSFKEGKLIKIFGQKMSDGFYVGELDGQRGLVPASFIIDTTELDSSSLVKSKVMVALYNYTPTKDSPNVSNDGELEFQAGDRIIVYGNMHNDGFYTGQIKGMYGLVPSNYVKEPEHI